PGCPRKKLLSHWPTYTSRAVQEIAGTLDPVAKRSARLPPAILHRGCSLRLIRLDGGGPAHALKPPRGGRVAPLSATLSRAVSVLLRSAFRSGSWHPRQLATGPPGGL